MKYLPAARAQEINSVAEFNFVSFSLNMNVNFTCTVNDFTLLKLIYYNYNKRISLARTSVFKITTTRKYEQQRSLSWHFTLNLQLYKTSA